MWSPSIWWNMSKKRWGMSRVWNLQEDVISVILMACVCGWGGRISQFRRHMISIDSCIVNDGVAPALRKSPALPVWHGWHEICAMIRRCGKKKRRCSWPTGQMTCPRWLLTIFVQQWGLQKNTVHGTYNQNACMLKQDCFLGGRARGHFGECHTHLQVKTPWSMRFFFHPSSPIYFRPWI